MMIGELFQVTLDLQTLTAKTCFDLFMTESCEYFCLCGKPAQVWCKKCNTQGYCGDVCKEQDDEQHSSICTKSKARAMENARTRRVSKISKK